jgi:phenylalanyl-tRNA synthetase beta subunit
LRTNLTDFFIDRMKFNLPNCLFDEEVIKIFEIGRVHPQAGEKISVAIGFGSSGKIKTARERVEKAVSEAENALGGFTAKWKATEKEDVLGRKNVFYKVLEIDWSEIEKEIDKLPVADFNEYLLSGDKKYKKISLYPRAVRDIALFVPVETEIKNVSKIIKNSAGELLAEEPVLFDDFSKDGKRSLAFRLVFQSDARSLEESEVNEIMKKVGEKVAGEGWEVR